jgi:hypothetical protein
VKIKFHIANLCKSTIDGHKHNLTMVSDVSPSTAAPKMKEYFVHMAYMSYDYACAQDGYLKHPHPTIIDGDMRWDSGWFLVCFGVGGHLTRNLPQSDYTVGFMIFPYILALIHKTPYVELHQYYRRTL